MGIETRLDLTRGEGETEASTFVGVRLGGYAGPLAAVVGFAGFYAFLLVAMSGGY